MSSPLGGHAPGVGVKEPVSCAYGADRVNDGVDRSVPGTFRPRSVLLHARCGSAPLLPSLPAQERTCRTCLKIPPGGVLLWTGEPAIRRSPRRRRPAAADR